MKNALIYLLLFISLTGRSQEPSFRHIGTRDGLSESDINCIYQGSRGFIWIATRDGLNRYDGYKFITYRYDIRDTSSLSDNFVADIAEDSAGNLWLATKNGLNEFHRKTSSFTHYWHDEHDSNSLADNVLNKLTFDKEGNLWIATQTNGLDCFDLGKGRFKHYRRSPRTKGSISDNSIRTVFRDSKNRIWAGTFSGGVNCFDPGKDAFEQVTLRDKKGNIVGKNIPCIFEDAFHQLWIGTQDDGLFLLDAEKRTLRCFTNSPIDRKTVSSNTILSMNEDARGFLWVGTENGGICTVDERTKEIHRILHDEIDEHSLSGNSIYAIARDRDYNIWIGTFNAGVDLYMNGDSNFIQYRHTSSPSSLSNNLVCDIFEDSRKNLWVATDGGGVNLQPSGTAGFVHWKQQKRGLSGNYVLTVKEMKAGRIWMGTWGNGISIFDPHTHRFDYLQHDPRKANSLSSNNIYAILQARDGKIWIGTANAGLDCYDERTRTFRHYKHDPNDSSSISSDLILSLLETPNGDLWVGTYDKGLNLLHSNGKAFSHFSYNSRYLYNKNIKSISNNSILDIFQDSRGDLWLGTFHGLNRLDVANKQFTVYTADDGLPGNTVFAMQEDKEGDLWISTNRGICAWHARTGKFGNYITGDGLQANEFKPHSAFRASNGDLYFGGINGMDRIDPCRESGHEDWLPVVLTAFQIFNKPVEIDETNEMTLSYRQNFLSFEFAALDFLGPKSKKYAYRLVGVDQDWNYVGNTNTANYTNLSPGKYEFQIKYGNGFGNWSPIYKKLVITIVPPFWLMGKFRVLAIAGLIALVYAYYKLRLRSIKAQKRRLEILVGDKTKEIVTQKEVLEIQQLEIKENNRVLERLLEEKDILLEEKGWLLKEVHHRVKNNLQVIVSLLNSQSSYLKDAASINAIMESKQRIYSISLIHERLYNSENMAAINMDSYINELIGSLCDCFDVRTSISFRSDVDPVLMGIEQALPVGLILNEAITNSIKYAFPGNRPGLIEVLLRRSPSGDVIVRINDSGVGFSRLPDGDNQTSLGFYLMQGLAAQLDAEFEIIHQDGVSIRLKFAYINP